MHVVEVVVLTVVEMEVPLMAGEALGLIAGLGVAGEATILRLPKPPKIRLERVVVSKKACSFRVNGLARYGAILPMAGSSQSAFALPDQVARSRRRSSAQLW